MLKVAFFTMLLLGLTVQAQDWTSSTNMVRTSKAVGIKTGDVTNPVADLMVNGRYTVFGGINPKSNFLSPDTGVELQSPQNAFLSIYGGINSQGFSSFFFTCAPQWHYAGFTSTKTGNGEVLPIVFSVDSGTGSPEKMRITPNGNIGIGTANPQTKLAVSGTVTAKEVVVTTTGWPDYVFKDDYRLMPLDQLAASIAEQGKLPGVPSADTIETNGVSLGEMQKTLMEKVEELTLYVLQLKQENDALKAAVGRLGEQP